jgi:hypothetical protein
MERKTALQTIERHAWGGNYFDSYSHAAMFRRYQPFNFGVRTSQLFSSQLGSGLINKKFTYMTIAKQNVYVLPGGTDDYQWYLMADADVDLRFTEVLVDPLGTAGKGNLPFRIALDRDWLSEPVLLKLENSNLPLLRVLGNAKQRSVNSWEYEVEVQSGDANAWIPVEYLQTGMRAVRVGTAVSDELNTKYGPDQYGEMFKLQSWCGNYANKVEFTDKFIRTEIACKKEGRPMPMNQGYSVGGKNFNEGAVSSGYVYQQKFNTTNSGTAEVYEKGVFITKAEARLLERTEMDRELLMEFGRLQKTVDRDSSRTLKVAPGWREIVKDGHFKEHNGTLTLSDIYEYLMEIFITRKTFSDRHIVIAGGEAAVDFLSRLIAQEASQFQYIDTLFSAKRTDGRGYHENELEYGAQFTKIKMANGVTVEIVYDPIKDDRKLFPELAPGTNRTLESFAMDIFDFGVTEQKANDAAREENITMVMQDGVESYFTVSNVYDFESGAEKSGGNVYGHNKESGIYREMSGSLCVWDVTRVGRIEFNPFLG